MQPQIVSVRDKSFFVCDYTGAPIMTRYFIPVGAKWRGKEGCYGSLPILLRAIYEEEGCLLSERFQKIKRDVETYFMQPDIPLQETLSRDLVPLSESDFYRYVDKVEAGMGVSWLLVPRGVTIEEAKAKKKRKVEKPETDEK